MSTTLTIAKREFRSNFDSPLAYVVICMSLFAVGLLFFNWQGGFWQADRASVARLFQFLPWMLSLLVVPVVTMRLIAEEKRSGTLEMLITLPVRDHEVVLGKFLGAWGLVLLIILSTALYPLMMFVTPWHLGSLDWGPVFTGYVGLIVYSAAAVAIGLLISSLTESQVIAVFVTVFVLGLLQIFLSMLAQTIQQPAFMKVTEFVTFDARLAPFARGMINTRDVIYFLSITVGCLMASFRALERRKWA
jgi:ABC-2 type transport system permease protein